MTNKEKEEYRFCMAGITGDEAFNKARQKMIEYSESLKKKKGQSDGTKDRHKS